MKEDTNPTWTFSEEEAKLLVSLIHKTDPIDPIIYQLYTHLSNYLYERMTLDELEDLLG